MIVSYETFEHFRMSQFPHMVNKLLMNTALHTFKGERKG